MEAGVRASWASQGSRRRLMAGDAGVEEGLAAAGEKVGAGVRVLGWTPKARERFQNLAMWVPWF
jgi:hypothetical protein